MLRGIDVSAYQSDTYDTDGLSFVFIKATEGRSYVNPKLTAQTKRARDGGCVVGFYHFLWPGNLTAQAEYFVSQAPERGNRDILAVDWETTGDGTHASNAEKDTFIRKVKELRPNNRVVLYTNRNYWLTIDTTSYAGDGLWIADYVTAGQPRIKADWLFHQYTDDPVDTNVADFTTKAALQKWADLG
ncbi:glycoside hydrolase family 25 protein [Streptomyces sp. NPDC002156]